MVVALKKMMLGHEKSVSASEKSVFVGFHEVCERTAVLPESRWEWRWHMDDVHGDGVAWIRGCQIPAHKEKVHDWRIVESTSNSGIDVGKTTLDGFSDKD